MGTKVKRHYVTTFTVCSCWLLAGLFILVILDFAANANTKDQLDFLIIVRIRVTLDFVVLPVCLAIFFAILLLFIVKCCYCARSLHDFVTYTLVKIAPKGKDGNEEDGKSFVEELLEEYKEAKEEVDQAAHA